MLRHDTLKPIVEFIHAVFSIKELFHEAKSPAHFLEILSSLTSVQMVGAVFFMLSAFAAPIAGFNYVRSAFSGKRSHIKLASDPPDRDGA